MSGTFLLNKTRPEANMKKCKSFVNSSQYVYGYLLYYLLCMCILLCTLYCFEVLQNYNAVILVFHVSYYQVLVSYIHFLN